MLSRLLGATLIGLTTAVTTGCATRDDFPMRNPDTGQEVTCHSGEYWIEEGSPQMRIATQCLQACAAHGFHRYTGNPYADNIQPKSPDDEMKPYIPAACLP